MSKLKNKDSWLWVVIQNPDRNTQYLGQRDEEKNISFIPAFLTKDIAQNCLMHLVKEKGQKYEAQAVLEDELVKHVSDSDCVIYIMDEDGIVIRKIVP